MKHRFLLVCLISLLALAMLLPLASCTGDPSPAETTAPVETKTETKTETGAETEVETESLPAEISLPEAYTAADIVYECDDGSVMYTFNAKAVADFEAVCAYYTEKGFRVYSSTVKAENRFTTFVGDGPMAHVSWLKDNGELNIVVSETAASTLPPVTPAITDGDYVCSVVQLKDNGNVNGMAYIIQLKDGSYIIYDGSYTSQARRIQKHLQENYTGEGKPVIRAWILTHSHNDHFPTFQTICRRMSNFATVEYIIYSPLNDESFTLDDEQGYYSSQQFKDDAAKLSGAKVVYAHTGMEFTFCNLKLEVLMTPETLFKGSSSFGNFNNTSVVTRLYDEGYSALFLGDIAELGAGRMASLYGDYLKSNICQVAHHGVEDVPLSFYETVQASILYYPCNIWLYDQTERHYEERIALENRDYTKEILIAGCGEYMRAWGTTFDANAPLSMPDYTVPDRKLPGADSTPDHPVDPTRLSTDKTTYKVGEPIMITAVGTGNDWVGIASSTSSGSLRWWCLSDGYGYEWVESGVAFDALSTPANYNVTDDLTPGEYLVVLVPDDKPYASGDFIATVAITITE